MAIVQHDKIRLHQLELKISLNLAWFISFTRFSCSKSYPLMFVISFWMRGVKYVAFFLEGFSIFSCKGSFVSANNLRMDKKLPRFWLLLISSLCSPNAMHCLAQSMFTLMNHFKISLFLRAFSVFKLSVKYGHVSSRFSNCFLVQQPFQYSPNAEILHVPQFFLLSWKI